MDDKILKLMRKHQHGVIATDSLTADVLLKHLGTKVIGREVYSYNVVDSTNSIASSLAEDNLTEGAAVFAEGQKKGRGRLRRSWCSPKSKGIYVSFILRPKVTLNKASFITLLAAVAASEAIREISGLRALIRWPNDILVNNKKVCGILTESQIKNKLIKYIILGIGINVNSKVSQLPVGATSLKNEAKRSFSRIELAQRLMRHLDREYHYFKQKGTSKIITQWKNLSALCGKRVRVKLAHKTIEGIAQGIDVKGALIVRLDNGFKHHLLAGDVVRLR